MNVLNAIANRMLGSSKKLAIGAVMALTLTSAGLAGAGMNKAYAADWSGNAIIPGGASSCQDLINKTRGNSQLRAIYSRFGLQPSDYNNFAHNCKHGVATRNNEIIVNGRTVATSVGSIGRFKSYQGSNPSHFRIAGTDFWGNYNSKAFARGTSSIPVDVLFNDKGVVDFAVMTGTCGNPTYQHPEHPTYSCDELHSSQVSGTKNTYRFSTSASAGHGAEISKVVYNFGDGSNLVERQSPSTVVTHTFTKDSKVTVTVYVKVPGGATVKLSGADCTKEIKFIPPAAVVACDLLTFTPGIVDNSGNTEVKLTAQASANHATVKSYTFTYGDGSIKTFTSNDKSFSVTHTYAPGTYTAKVLVVFITNTGKVISRGNTGKCVVTKQVPPVSTSLVCKNLVPTKGAVDSANGNTAYDFTATAAANRATIKNYVFDLGNNLETAHTETVATANTTATSKHYIYAPGSHTVKVVVNGTDLYGKPLTTAPATGNCVVTFTVPPHATNPGVTITKLVDNVKKEQVAVGQTFTYELKVTNTGDVNLVNAVVTDTPPAGVTLLSADKGSIVNNHWTYTIPSLKVGESASFNLTGKVNTYVAGELVNTACVNAVEVNPGQPTKPDACDTAIVTVTPPVAPNPGVTITKHVDNVKDEQVAVGQTFTYELVVKNTGNVDLKNAVVTDTPPAGVKLLTADKGAITNNIWTYTIPSLAVGESMTFNLTANVPAFVDGSLVNRACVNAVEVNPGQPTAPDACDTATVHVPPVVPTNPNVTITKTVDGQKSEQVAVGQNFVYQLVIKNTGEKTLVNAVVSDPAPTGVKMISSDLGTITNNVFSYTIPSLAVGASVTVNITANVPAFVDGDLLNKACVNAVEVNPEQPNLPDACDTATVSLTPPVVTPPVVTPPAVAPTVLPNTGAGSVLSLFGASAIVGIIGYRLFLSRRLNRQ